MCMREHRDGAIQREGCGRRQQRRPRTCLENDPSAPATLGQLLTAQWQRLTDIESLRLWVTSLLTMARHDTMKDALRS